MSNKTRHKLCWCLKGGKGLCSGSKKKEKIAVGVITDIRCLLHEVLGGILDEVERKDVSEKVYVGGSFDKITEELFEVVKKCGREGGRAVAHEVIGKYIGELRK